MAKVTLPTFSSLTNETSFLEQLNAAMTSLAAAIELTLSRNGTTPNTMTASLDMNSQRLINLPAPTGDNDPIRLIDSISGIRGPAGTNGAAGADGAPGGGVADADYGDIVVSSSASVFTIDSAVMTSVARTLNAQTTQALMRTAGLALGNSATLNTGVVAGTVATGDDTRFTAFTINSQSGATYTFALTDPGKLVRQTAAGTHTYTIDPVSNTAYPVGSVILLRNAVGAGALTLALGSGVGLYINGATSSAAGTVTAGAVVELIHEASNSWLALGVGIS